MSMSFDATAIKENQSVCDQVRQKLKKDGPWNREPDRLEFKAYGLDCLLSRHPMGFHWCGYVGVPKDHPLHGVEYSQESEVLKGRLDKLLQTPANEVPMTMARSISALCGDLKARPDTVLDVHGGITYSRACEGPICHDAPEKVWWFGFDCAHYGDYSPGFAQSLAELTSNDWRNAEEYKDLRFVITETLKLAQQLDEIGKAA